MAICGNCGAETTRVRSRWEKNVQLADECPQCAPQSFEKQSDPSDKKIWIGPEVRPNDYEKRYDSEGVFYKPKPEITAELEAKVFRDSDEEVSYRRALDKKRAERRTREMSAAELHEAVSKVDRWFRPLIEDPDVSYDA
jgi:hypothetical protein